MSVSCRHVHVNAPRVSSPPDPRYLFHLDSEMRVMHELSTRSLIACALFDHLSTKGHPGADNPQAPAQHRRELADGPVKE